jgi:2-polyprenyl-3-methyl-5-hydroxy-6-metoxy-1,4-benzoquinol methylase
MIRDFSTDPDTPELEIIVDLIAEQNPLQGRQILHYIRTQDDAYREFAETLCGTLNRTLLNGETEKAEAASSYNRMCMDFLREQIRFKKSGSYKHDSAVETRQTVYDQPSVMRYYMIGLLLSYIFWPNHYRMFRFFREHLAGIDPIHRHLDIAPGHGLFSVEVLRSFSSCMSVLVDISRTSIDVTRDILKAFQIGTDRLTFIHQDIFSVSLERNRFNLITMGEILEHVEDPNVLLQKVVDLLHPAGAVFLTTCANCPAIDHVYHFHSVDEIRETIGGSGLDVIDDLALPVVEDNAGRPCDDHLTTVNYCAILARAETFRQT